MYYSSTTLGSNATYHCRDDQSVVYTSQCIDGGVWWPDIITCNKRGIHIILYYICMHLVMTIISDLCGAD